MSVDSQPAGGRLNTELPADIRDLLRRSEQRYQSLFEHMRNGVAYCRMIFENGAPVDFAYLAVNRAFAELTGLTNVVGRRVTEILPGLGESQPWLLETYGRVSTTGADESFEIYIDEIKAWLAVNVYSNEPGTFVAVFENITERKLLMQRVENEKNLLLAVINGLPDLVFAKDTAGRFMLVNRALADLAGVKDPVELVGKTDYDISPKSIADKYVADDQRVIETGQVLINEEEVSVFGSGSSRYLLTTKVPLRDTDGSVRGVVGIGRDITERREFERRIEQAQRLESLGVLAGGIAHDFNNILMTILGNADLIQATLATTSPARKNLQEISRAVHRASDLCRQMVAYSGKGRFQVQYVDLSEVIEEMRGMLGMAVSKKAVVTFSLAKGLPSVQADLSQIRQVIMNLVINASEAIGENDGVVTIATGFRDCDETYLRTVWSGESLTAGRYISLEVTDTGCGMSEATRSRIFEPFFTTKFAGRGLGLAAVDGIIRGHRGAIKVYSEPDKGTTFRLLFPASSAPPQALGAVRGSCGQWQGHGTVLLVDDEESIRVIGQQMLEHLGFCVVTAADGVESLDLLRARGSEIVCVILDLTMPRMDGEETFNQIRAIQPGMKIILSSGYNEQAVVQKFTGLGLAGFIQKPYELSSLELKLREVLGE